MGWLKKKLCTISEALSGLDDPRGDHMLGLEARIQHLEGEIARLEALVGNASDPGLNKRLLLSDWDGWFR